jgi:hypothetical protein
MNTLELSNYTPEELISLIDFHSTASELFAEYRKESRQIANNLQRRYRQRRYNKKLFLSIVQKLLSK